MKRVAGVRYSSPNRFTFRQRLVLTLVPPLIGVVLKLLALTWRIEVRGRERLDALLRDPGRCVIPIWHEVLAVAACYFRNTGWHTLTSYSFDGELGTRVLRRFGILAARGSSSRGGSGAVHDLTAVLREVSVIGFTVDGPRGPRRVAKAGVAVIAARAGIPLICFNVKADRAWRLRSWDRFMIPKPFARVTCVFGEAIATPASDGEEHVEAVRARVERALVELVEEEA